MALPTPTITATAARTSRPGPLLGGLGLASAAFVLARLFETWHAATAIVSHHITVLGLRIGANAGPSDTRQ